MTLIQFVKGTIQPPQGRSLLTEEITRAPRPISARTDQKTQAYNPLHFHEQLTSPSPTLFPITKISDPGSFSAIITQTNSAVEQQFRNPLPSPMVSTASKEPRDDSPIFLPSNSTAQALPTTIGVFDFED